METEKPFWYGNADPYDAQIDRARVESKVGISRIKGGNRQIIETLISEESLLLAKFVRDERKRWIPRIGLP